MANNLSVYQHTPVNDGLNLRKSQDHKRYEQLFVADYLIRSAKEKQMIADAWQAVVIDLLLNGKAAV